MLSMDYPTMFDYEPPEPPEGKDCPFCGRFVLKEYNCFRCECPAHNKRGLKAFKEGYEAPYDQDSPPYDEKKRSLRRAWAHGKLWRIKVEREANPEWQG